MNTERIYQRPEDYDLEHEGQAEDARFYGHLLRRLHPTRILELACGSGRVTAALAAALPHAEMRRARCLPGDARPRVGPAGPQRRHRPAARDPGPRRHAHLGRRANRSTPCCSAAARRRTSPPSPIGWSPGGTSGVGSGPAAPSSWTSRCPIWPRWPNRSGWRRGRSCNSTSMRRGGGGRRRASSAARPRCMSPICSRPRCVSSTTAGTARTTPIASSATSRSTCTSRPNSSCCSRRAASSWCSSTADYGFVPFGRTSPYLITLAKRPAQT